MSQGGIFNLLLEDERNDKFLTASNYLQTRITDIISKRKTANAKIRTRTSKCQHMSLIARRDKFPERKQNY